MLGTVQKGNYAHFYLCINLPMHKSRRSDGDSSRSKCKKVTMHRSSCKSKWIITHKSSRKMVGILLSVSAKKVIIDKSN